MLAMARLWLDAVNRHGGDARLVHLPDIGVRGNTHFLMSDLTNVQIANQVTAFLVQKKLDWPTTSTSTASDTSMLVPHRPKRSTRRWEDCGAPAWHGKRIALWQYSLNVAILEA